MDEPDFTSGGCKWFDEQSHSAPNYSAQTALLVPKREWPDWSQDITIPGSSGQCAVEKNTEELKCGSFQQPVVQKIKTEEPVPPLIENTPERHGYTWSEMSPTIRDPLCKSASALACFWPVYVDNFRCESGRDEFDCVKEYFAGKRLHVRWWVRKIDEYYDVFQSQARIFDMLVYFLMKQDAQLAIKLCHRDLYKGHSLNVFPGRVPVYFDTKRSLQTSKMTSGLAYSELFFERYVKERCNVEISCTVKFDADSGAMEFATATQKVEVLNRIIFFRFREAREELQKQRFLERDLMMLIENDLKLYPAVLQVNPNDKYLQLLLRNQRPCVNPNPLVEPRPLKCPSKNTKPSGKPKSRTQREKERMRKHIAEAMAAGREPKCNETTKAGRQRYMKLVRQAKRSAGHMNARTFPGN